MASSASTTLRLELMATGENDTTWGNKINTNFQIMESAVSGVTSVSTTGGNTTLTNVDYTNDQAKKAVLDVTGALVSNATITIPNAAKVYRVLNRTSGAYTLGIKTSSGTAITITQSTSAEVYCDGSNTMRFVTPLTDFTTGAPATSSGAAASAVSVTPTGNLSSTNAQAALAELQGDIDTVNALLTSNYQPLDADLTALAATATQAYGRSLLTYASEAALKAGVNLEANTDFYAPGGTDVPVTDGGTGASTASAARTNLGLAIGADVQAYDGDLAAIAALTTQSYGRTLLTYADEAAFKAAVNLEANTDFYAPGGTDVPVTDGGTGASTAANARTNLGVTATGADTTYSFRANNLSDLASAATAFANIKQAASDTETGVLGIAVQSEMETGTSTTLAVVPGRQHYHPGHPKFFYCVTVSGSTPTLATSYNMTSVTDTAVGRLTPAIATDFSSANWAATETIQMDSGLNARTHYIAYTSQTAGTFEHVSRDGGGGFQDPAAYYCSGLGDQ